MTHPDFRAIEIDLAVHRAIERERRSVGESENDILRRVLLPARRPDEPRRGSEAMRRGQAGAGRSRGLWTVEIGGQRLAAANLKDAFRILLLALAAAHPHFLHAFAQEPARGRRYVAQSPSGLYLRSPHLARAHAQKLLDGWYFDSNLSSTQVARRARIAARLCGLFYGQDVRILDNLRQI